MLIATSGFFIFFDQWLKFLARNFPEARISPFPWFGWEYFANPGIAFSLPFPNLLLIILTPFILAWLFVAIFFKNTAVTNNLSAYNLQLRLGVCLIFSGALSNLIDRILFAATIDYLRIFTSVINLADVMIVLGGLLVLLKWKKK